MERSLARSNVYSLLSLCFSYPNDEIYGFIARGERLREARKSLHMLADDHFEECLRLFEEVSCGGKRATQWEMAHQYERCAIDASPRTAPFRDATSPGNGGSVFGQTTSEVLRCFREAGFTPSPGDISGHISQQLEFMSFLAKQESRASRRERIRLEEIQLDFLSRFLIAQVSIYGQRVMNQNGSPFYLALGDVTREFIGFERNYLGMPEEKEQLDKRRESGADTEGKNEGKEGNVLLF